MSVAPLWGLMLSMITSFHVLTILLIPLELFREPWECQEVNGETWIYPDEGFEDSILGRPFGITYFLTCV
ncbi:hypothetical protein CFP56_022840 [Quercus suber]|uniref:Uncharacterized protein n=1 Tax=Quercus suber TaxID=58331 RepID=A0AAW0KA72_QUESU